MSEPEPELSEIEKHVEKKIYFSFIFQLAAYCLLVGYFFYTFRGINSLIPLPFIDEKFHLRQTIKYLAGDYSWDSKITTPPGLYVLGYINAKVGNFITNWNTTTILRTTNMIAGVFVWPYIVLRPVFLLHAFGFWPLNLMCFPLMVTYYYLYYTDIWSTIFITEALSLVLCEGSTNLSALCVFISLWFRQTNIVWNLFIMVVYLERKYIKDLNGFNINNYLKLFIHGVEDFAELLPYVANFVLFFVFLVWNRSITLGDNENHVAGLHLAQVLYCSVFICAMSWPVWFSKSFLLEYYDSRRSSWIWTLVRLALLALVVRFFTIVHPFLLADNRHYTFYLFKKILRFKYLLLPVYDFSIFTVLSLPCMPLPNVGEFVHIQMTHMSFTTYLVCVVFTLVPSPLFEPRYYILPYVFWRIFQVTPASLPFWNERTDDFSNKRFVVEFIWFMLVNVGMYIVFTRYGFAWSDEVQLQRIIW